MSFNCLQELGADSTMDRGTSKSSNKVYCGGLGSCLQHAGSEGLYTQGWVQERCSLSAGSGSDGRSSSLPQPREARGDQQPHL